MTDRDDILQQIERDSMAKAEAVRQMLRDAGRPDLLEEFDRNMRDLRLGITGAKNTWHSISEAQRRVLIKMANGCHLLREKPGSNWLNLKHPTGAFFQHRACLIATARALCAHELIHVAGGATDPEGEFVITERGQFVVRHGKPAP